MYVTLLVLSALIIGALGYSGVDVSQRTYSSSFSCMVDSGYHFAVVRVYQSSGHCDSNGPYTINDAWAGGMSYVDGYIFPCYSCGNAAQQVDDTINCLQSSGIKILQKGQERPLNTTSTSATVGMLWMDIEGTQYWSSSSSSNVAFLTEMVNEAEARGYVVGIYSSQSQWDPIMGGSTAFSQYPLWYAHYDYNPSFSDFSPFGGWSSPSIKQYQGTTSLCSASVDLNYY
mmetsp:Transcript_5589/g.13975  ORF Transcript_5589/g.13975 Transcript_5589/m.13975 type:complete len:229 (+) Transcript_5589:25-711(+)